MRSLIFFQKLIHGYFESTGQIKWKAFFGETALKHGCSGDGFIIVRDPQQLLGVDMHDLGIGEASSSKYLPWH